MFRIKICGITSVDDALTAVRAGADAIGLNFYPRSPRYISLDTARQIVAAVPKGIVKVGLFVNAPAPDVCQTCDELHLDLIQLHGDEPPEYLTQLDDRPIIRAFRVGADGLAFVSDYLARCRQLQALPKLVLLDSLVAGEFGGTGKVVDWSVAQQYVTQSGLPPLVLAGGLTPDNVAEAIQAIRPAAVDVASGVESSPGRKDPAAIVAFVRMGGSAWFEHRYWPFPVLPPNERTSLHQAQISFCERAAAAGLRAYSFFDHSCFGADGFDGRSGDIVRRGPRNTRWEVVLYDPGYRNRTSEWVSDFAAAADIVLKWLQTGARRTKDVIGSERG
jgi:phosphoribosylanthranilate isomerase